MQSVVLQHITIMHWISHDELRDVVRQIPAYSAVGSLLTQQLQTAVHHFSIDPCTQRTILAQLVPDLHCGFKLIKVELQLHVLLIHLALQALSLPPHSSQDLCLLAPAAMT